MIFLLLEFLEIETHFLNLAREKAPQQRRFSPFRHQPELFPGRISRVRFSTTRAVVPGETRTAGGAQEISAPAPPVCEEAGLEAGRAPLTGAGGEEEPGTSAARSGARGLPVSGRSPLSRGKRDKRGGPALCRETPPRWPPLSPAPARSGHQMENVLHLRIF